MNVSLFSNTFQKIEVTYVKIISSVFYWHREKSAKMQRDYSFPSFVQDHPLVYFDGLQQMESAEHLL